ncbi:methanogenesis marker 3 protein [Methanonatronarchaeum sp. AMET6-2]|uniref:methyl-coenzyme M reductase-associated protein Mmp3 n=1 Tax=Methanonatronarchaeum sp. AMET6-2 TaxID=2933293 RepID=UPI001FF3962C|nr:methanogenesis marker 3 protein [Methanonatronarchaeum sp. AMET6-2]UOY10252.1 methanogenesis marker 3 protein [Methanonatronarchaeum sp. AMET6-2]
MKVVVDGETREVSSDTRLGDLLELDSGCSVGVVRKVERVVEEREREYQLETTAGDFTLTLNQSGYADSFIENVENLSSLGVRWVSNKIVAFGPFSSEVEIDKSDHQYDEGDVFFGVSGLDNDNTYMMMARNRHKKGYGTGGGVIGHIKRGKHMVDVFSEGDRIEEIERLKSEREKHDSFSTTDPDTELEDGMQIYSHLKIELDQRSPLSAEYFLRKTERGYIEIDEATETYLKTEGKLRNLAREENSRRLPGTITVRNEGDGRGNIYIYRKERPMHPNHNAIGSVTQGTPLLDILDEGCKVKIKTSPQRLLSIGLTQQQANEMYNNHDIKHSRKGSTSDESIIIRQEPRLTLDLIDNGEVETMAVDPDQIITVELYSEQAPQTTDYFKRVSRLISEDVGQLEVYFASQKISNVMFKGDQDLAGNLKPENTPEQEVEKGEIGITNMSKPNKGMIGIRLEPSGEYGPTGEGFKATNLAGKVVKGLDNLKELESSQKIYIKEDVEDV